MSRILGKTVIPLLGLFAQVPPLACPAAAAGEGGGRVEITPVLHMGDPAPGIPGAEIVWVEIPQIDGDGNLLVWAYFRDQFNNVSLGLWYGQPGELELVAFDGMQAPGMAAGVKLADIKEFWLAENGWIGITSVLSGPGTIPGFNNQANFAGPPGDIQKVWQGGEQAPGLEPGTIFDVSEGYGLTAWLSDNATMLVVAWLSGPAVDEFNDQAIWIGPRDDLQLIWRKGMIAPGTNGARFRYPGGIRFNDNLEMAIRGELVREGEVDHTNDLGYWAGPPGGLQLVARKGAQAPGMPEGVDLLLAGSYPTLGGNGTTGFRGTVVGEGITEDNELASFNGTPGAMAVLAQEDDLIPGVPGDVRYAQPSSHLVSASGAIAFRSRLRGDVDPSNDVAILYGAPDAPRVLARKGDRVRGFVGDVVFNNLLLGVGALNDEGDLLGRASVSDNHLPEEDTIVITLAHHATRLVYPLLRARQFLEAGQVEIPDFIEVNGMTWLGTSGSDGDRQGFNDQGTVAIKIPFADGTAGVYTLRLRTFGDGDNDGGVDLADYALFLQCVTDFSESLADDCLPFDIDWDDDIDLADFGLFQMLFGDAK